MQDLSTIKLYSYSSLKELQREYYLGEEYFIFATMNGDPIALHDQNVVLVLHGTKERIIELMANSFDIFLYDLIQTMKVIN